jgi:protein-S-isoprenylcysteine O-methyltransferase
VIEIHHTFSEACVGAHIVMSQTYSPDGLVELVGILSNPDWDKQFAHFHHRAGLGRVALTGGCLCFLLGLHIALLVLSVFNGWSAVLQWSLYAISLLVFHLLEFVLTALYNPRFCTADSFLVNHSRAYTIAAVVSWIEFWVELFFAPGLKGISLNIMLGGVLVFAGQCCRTLAMHTAGTNFHHIVQTRRDSRHRLVTTGIYAIFRHPSYFGWFWWSVGTQVLLGNPICVVAYTAASWRFFADRIPFEEAALQNMYPKEYPGYCKRTMVGIPLLDRTTA